MNSNTENTIKADPEVEQWLAPLLYFDIFSYPLTLEEIILFGQVPDPAKDRIKSILLRWVASGRLFLFNEYFSVSNQPGWVQAREQNHHRAEIFKRKAVRMSRLIALFPFVRGVFISGSLSKDIMLADGDIDYFIITHRSRLWIARTLLILFKKIFLFNSHKYFCLNYFVDEDHLEIEEKNIYTATEIVTLIPMHGSKYYTDFCHANLWTKKYFPNFPMRSTETVVIHKSGWFKNAFEKMFLGRAGAGLNSFLMEQTINYWRIKFKTFDAESFSLAFKSTVSVSKHHPRNFQSRVLKAYQERIRIFEENHQVKLNVKI